MPEKPEAMLFDVGNVLLRLHMEKFFGALAAVAPRLDPETIHAELKREDGPHLAYERGEISGEDFFKALKARYEIPWDYTTWLSHWLDFFLPNRPMEILIAKLSGKVRLFALSNTNADHYALFMRDYRLFDAFENVMGSQELGLRKPDPKIYEEALRRLAIPAEKIIYVDDLQANIDQGERHGMRSFRYHFNDLELKAYLKGEGLELEEWEKRPSPYAC